MYKGKREAKKTRKKWDRSQLLTLLVILFGFGLAQECIALMYLCIKEGYTSTAAWLTAAVGLAEAIIAAGLTGYLSLCKSDHKEGGITFEAAKSKNFQTTNDDAGSIDSPAI